MTTVIRGTDDSASTPALTGTDADTGVFFPAANTMAMSTGGSERMRIDSSGNVGIGSTSPSTFDDAGTGGRNVVIQSTGTGRGVLTFASAQTDGANELLGRINFIDSDSTNSSYRGASIDGILGADANSAFLRFNTANSGNGTERARITSNGNILFGSTATWDTGNGSSFYIANNSDKSTLRVSNEDPGSPSYGLIAFHRNKGAFIAKITTDGSTVAYNTSSDYRLKENVVSMTGALEKVSQLNPVTYTWKETGKNGQGFIAHELAEVCPDAVSGEKDAVETYTDEEGVEQTRPVHQGVDTSFLVATLTAAIQELKTELDQAKTRIAALEAQ